VGRRIAGKTNVWVTLNLTNAISTGGATFTNLPDQSLLATGVNPTYDTYQIEAETVLQNITAVLLEVLPDPSLPKNGPGRWSQTGNFILDELAMTRRPGPAIARPLPTSSSSRRPPIGNSSIIVRNKRWIATRRPAGRSDQKFGQGHFLIAELAQPISFTEAGSLASG